MEQNKVFIVHTYFDTVVVIPVGPGTHVPFVADTINSFIFFAEGSFKFIIADDSHQALGVQLQKLFPSADILVTEKPMGGWAGLYINLANTYRHALKNYSFKILLKLDTDALVIGYLEKEIIHFFEKNTTVGMAGQYPNDYHGKPWDIGWPKARVLNGATNWRYIKRPVTNWFLRKIYLTAKENGYRAGESVFGGAYAFSYVCLKKMQTEGLLPFRVFGRLNMGEDHIFSLLVKYIGFDLGSLSEGHQPFALAWKGLPASPEVLVKQGKKIIHSTRFWQDQKEENIRQYFRELRQSVRA